MSQKGTIPPPREGLLGEWDKFVGPGAAGWENAGTLGFAAVGAVAAPAMVRRQRPEANPLELAAASAMGLDIAGGAWCNETPSCKRWYHRAGSTRRARIGFAALHLYPFLAELVSGRRQWRNAAVSYLSLTGAAALLELASSEHKRSVASGLYTAWLAGTSVAAPPPAGYAWLPSLLGFKLLLGHGTPRGPLAALRRRPRRFRPSRGRDRATS
jgi:hypothetical protein